MIFCSWVIVLSPFPVPEGGSRSQFGVRTAPALGTRFENQQRMSD